MFDWHREREKERVATHFDEGSSSWPSLFQFSLPVRMLGWGYHVEDDRPFAGQSRLLRKKCLLGCIQCTSTRQYLMGHCFHQVVVVSIESPIRNNLLFRHCFISLDASCWMLLASWSKLPGAHFQCCNGCPLHRTRFVAATSVKSEALPISEISYIDGAEFSSETSVFPTVSFKISWFPQMSFSPSFITILNWFAMDCFVRRFVKISITHHQASSSIIKRYQESSSIIKHHQDSWPSAAKSGKGEVLRKIDENRFEMVCVFLTTVFANYPNDLTNTLWIPMVWSWRVPPPWGL